MSEERGEYKAGELKPCPWCGAEPVTTDAPGVTMYKCSNPECLGASVYEPWRMASVWNTRATDAENARLRAALAVAREGLRQLADDENYIVMGDEISDSIEWVGEPADIHSPWDYAADALREMGEG